MARPEDSAWAVSVAQVASRPGQSKTVDAVFPAPSGIGDEVIGVKEGADVSVHGSFDSIVDGLVLTARIEALREYLWVVVGVIGFPSDQVAAIGKRCDTGKLLTAIGCGIDPSFAADLDSAAVEALQEDAGIIADAIATPGYEIVAIA